MKLVYIGAIDISMTDENDVQKIIDTLSKAGYIIDNEDHNIYKEVKE